MSLSNERAARDDGRASIKSFSRQRSFEIGKKWIKRRLNGARSVPKFPESVRATATRRRNSSLSIFDRRVPTPHEPSSQENDDGVVLRRASSLSRASGRGSLSLSLSSHTDSPIEDRPDSPVYLNYLSTYLSPTDPDSHLHPLVIVTEDLQNVISRCGSPALQSATSWTLGDSPDPKMINWESMLDMSQDSSTEGSPTPTPSRISAAPSLQSPFIYDRVFNSESPPYDDTTSSPMIATQDSGTDGLDKFVNERDIDPKSSEEPQVLKQPLRIKPLQTLVIPPRQHMVQPLHIPFLHTRQPSSSSTTSTLPETPFPQTPIDSTLHADIWNTLQVLREGSDDDDLDVEISSAQSADEDALLSLRSLVYWDKSRGNYI
ncbi:hypothetical protein FRC02_005572 [Tulasnella sp. 418]|nr:hypothetical protein FRC02_005572 [Tulasnella sp. 418]